jgi:hypothetical protein
MPEIIGRLGLIFSMVRSIIVGLDVHDLGTRMLQSRIVMIGEPISWFPKKSGQD